jgi:hypothetical protein
LETFEETGAEEIGAVEIIKTHSLTYGGSKNGGKRIHLKHGKLYFVRADELKRDLKEFKPLKKPFHL